MCICCLHSKVILEFFTTLYSQDFDDSIYFSLFFSSSKYSNNNYNNNHFPSKDNVFIPKTGDSNVCLIQQSLIEYEVKKGDTFKNIWQNNVVSYPYEIAVNIVLRENKLDNIYNIYEGQILLLPIIMNTKCIKYIIKNSDTLSSVLEQYMPNTSLCDGIKILSDINGEYNLKTIEEGQTLLIPYN